MVSYYISYDGRERQRRGIPRWLKILLAAILVGLLLLLLAALALYLLPSVEEWFETGSESGEEPRNGAIAETQSESGGAGDGPVIPATETAGSITTPTPAPSAPAAVGAPFVPIIPVPTAVVGAPVAPIIPVPTAVVGAPVAPIIPVPTAAVGAPVAPIIPVPTAAVGAPVAPIIPVPTAVVGAPVAPATPAPTAAVGAPPANLTCGERDKAALVEIYGATDGANWINKEGWQSDAPLGEWDGVELDGEGCVAELALSANGLKGAMPAALGNLHSLTHLDLGTNELTGAIPATLGNLSKLKYLALDANGLTGEVPAELGNLPSLGYLFLSENQLTGDLPAALGNRNMVRWKLAGSGLTGCVPASWRGAEWDDRDDVELQFCG